MTDETGLRLLTTLTASAPFFIVKPVRMFARLAYVLALLAVSGAVASTGCVNQDSTSGFRLFGRSPHTSDPAEPGASADARFSDSLLTTTGSSDRVEREPVRVVRAAFDVVRADIPLSDIRHSRKLWNHVSADRIPPEVMLRLARNGVQIGVGDASSWPAIRAILEAADAEVRRDPLYPSPGLPLVIEIGAIETGGESIFAYHRRDRLEGRTYEAGAKLLIVDYSFPLHVDSAAELRVSLEIRHDRGEMRWERWGETLRQVPLIDRYLFDELRAGIGLAPGEFLVIGPGELSTNAYLVGSRFFSAARGGIRRDTVFLITPQHETTTFDQRKRS